MLLKIKYVVNYILALLVKFIDVCTDFSVNGLYTIQRKLTDFVTKFTFSPVLQCRRQVFSKWCTKVTQRTLCKIAKI